MSFSLPVISQVQPQHRFGIGPNETNYPSTLLPYGRYENKAEKNR